MKTIKRSIAVILTVLLILSLVPVSAYADDKDNAKDSVNNITSMSGDSFENDPVPEYLLDENEEDCRNWLQYDERWNSIPLGSSSLTIGSSGCTLTSICKLIIQNQLATAKTLNPKILGRWLNNNGGYNNEGLIQWGKVEEFCDSVLGKKFTIDINKSSYPASDVNAYQFAGTGEQNIYASDSYFYKNDDAGHDRYVAHIARMKALMEAGYHLVINVHDGGHWIAVDEIKTKTNNYDHIYITNSWISDGTEKRETLEDYLDYDAVKSNGTHYTSINRFQRIAAYKTTDSSGDNYSRNEYGYSNTDDFKKWSRYDNRWATTVLDEPTANKADYIGDWGQALIALDKELIQSGVKTSSYTPDSLKTALSTASLIGSTTGIIDWVNIKNFDEKITDSGVAYSNVTVSSKSSEMLKKMKEEGYHYIVNINSNSSDDDAWVAIDEEKSLAEGKLYKLSSNLVTSNNINNELTGSIYSVKYFKTSPSYVPVTFSGTHSTVTAAVGGESINSGDFVKIGSEVTVTAVPDTDYKLDKWTVNDDDNAETSNTLTLTVNETSNVVYNAKAMTVVYLDKSAVNDDASNVVWYAWTYPSDAQYGEGKWIKGSETSDGYIKFSDVDEKLNFVRMNKNSEDNPNWDAKFNQTANETVPNDGRNLYTITGWGPQNGDMPGTWSTLANNTVYLYPNAVSTNNKKTNPENDTFIYAWTWNTLTDGHFITGTLQDNGLIKFEKVQNNIKFARMNGDAPTLPPADLTINSTTWNVTADIRLADYPSNDLFVLDRFDGSSMTFYANNSSGVTENDYRYWTKTDPRWDGVRFGTSTDTTDLAGRYTLSQAIAKLAIQAGLRDSSNWTVADCARDCYGSDGLVSRALIASGSGLTNYIFRRNNGTKTDGLNDDVIPLNMSNSDISNAILEGYHFAFLIKNTDNQEEDVALDEKTSLEKNEIWVWRCTQTGEANSVKLSTIRKAGTNFVRICRFEGGTTPGLTSDFDYRRWSRYDGRWKNNQVGTTGEHTHMYDNGACIIAVAKMFVQAGVKSDTNFTPEDLRAYLAGLPNNTGLTANGSLIWESVNNYVENTLEFDTHYTSDSNNLIYLKFAEPIDGVSGYPMKSSSYDGTQCYNMSEESDRIMEAIRQGYHMLIEVKQNDSNTQSWVVVDEKASLESGQVMVMDSTKDLSSNADNTSAYTQFYRIVGYKGATTPIIETVVENNVEIPAVEFNADPADPAYIDSTGGTASYVYGTTGDGLLILKSASAAQTYRYSIADTEALAKEFTTYTDVTSSQYNYSNGTVTINIADAFDTDNNGGTKYIAVKAVNGSAESNVVTASMTYDTVKLTAGFGKDGTTNDYSAEIDRDNTYTLTVENALSNDSAYSSTVEINPNVSADSKGSDASSKLSGLVFTGDEAGTYLFTLDSATASITKGSKTKSSVPVTINSNNKFTVDVNQVYVDVTYYQNFTGEDTAVTAVKKTVKGSAVENIPAPPERSGYTFKGWYTARSGGEQAAAAATYNADTPLYAQWEMTGFTISFYETTQSVNPCYTVIVDPGAKIPENEFYKATPDRGNNYLFKGWYDNSSTAIDKNAVYTSDCNIYAHWIDNTSVAQDTNDKNITDGNYSGYGLKGVQIREESEDGNYLDENGKPIKMPAGLRYITSLSQPLLDEIDRIDNNSIDGTNVEYGYIVTKESMAKGYYNHYFGTENIPSTYKLKYLGENVNGENTTGQKPYSADTDYRYVTNVNCTSADYDSEAAAANRKYDHKKFANYRLYSMVITYEGESDEAKAEKIIARPYLKYTDANGLTRYRYDEYAGNSNKCGGCCVSYSSVQDYADFVSRQESE